MLRLTEEMRGQIDSYCRKHNMTEEEFSRYACAYIFATGELERARVEKVRALIEKSRELQGRV